MAIYLSSGVQIQDIVKSLTSGESVRRRNDAFKAQRILNGLQRQYIDQRLSQLYPDGRQYLRVSDINIPKKIIERRARAYSNMPSRKGVNDAETERINELYKRFMFDAAFRDLDFTFNYFKYGFLFLNYGVDEQGEVTYHLMNLPPYKFDMVFDPITGEPWAFAICNKAPYGVGTRFHIWTQYRFYEIDCYTNSGGSTLGAMPPVPSTSVDLGGGYRMNVQLDNFLGILPGAYVQEDTDVGFPPSNTLADRSIEWNVGMTDVKTAITVQGTGIPMFKVGQDVKVEGKVELGRFKALILPQPNSKDQPPTEFEFATPKPNISESLDVLRFELQMILEENGLRGKSIVAPTTLEQFSSGFDRLISEADAQYIINRNQDKYSEQLEQGLFKALKAYEEAFNRYQYSSEGLEIYFDKPKVLISDRETLENLAMRLKLGTLLPWEKHIILNPNLTEEEAKQREAAIDASGVKEEYVENLQPGMQGEGSANKRPVSSESDSGNGG